MLQIRSVRECTEPMNPKLNAQCAKRKAGRDRIQKVHATRNEPQIPDEQLSSAECLAQWRAQWRYEAALDAALDAKRAAQREKRCTTSKAWRLHYAAADRATMRRELHAARDPLLM
jgi:hypothetical protein